MTTANPVAPPRDPYFLCALATVIAIGGSWAARNKDVIVSMTEKDVDDWRRDGMPDDMIAWRKLRPVNSA